MTSETIHKLQEMRLSVMAKTYLDQIDHLEDYANMSFDERFSLIVDREADVRLNNKLKRLVHQAQFPNKTGSDEHIAMLSAAAIISFATPIHFIVFPAASSYHIFHFLRVRFK